ncbi:MAG TPA: MFS transporter [Stellaceae bacterium]|nr:MFS transporter [Stellaceae bacterium]
MAERLSVQTIDVAEIIDRQPISRLQIIVIALCAAALFADGFDVQVMGYIAPSLARAWQLQPKSLGPVFSAGLFGLMIGALFWSPIADRIGRKAVILMSITVFALGALATPLARSLDDLMFLRLLTGIGLGGAMPNAIALTSEYAPRRLRTTFVMVMWFGFTIGSGFGGAIAAKLKDLYGWQAAFYFGGIVPLLLLPLLALCLPESIRLLALRGANRRVAAILARIDRGTVYDLDRTRFVIGDDDRRQFPVSTLFAEGRARVTLLLWVMFFMNLLNLYFLASWMPTLIHGSGIAEDTAILATSLIHLGGMAGAIVLGALSDRIGSYIVLTLCYLSAGAFIAVIGAGGDAVGLVVGASFGAGFCVAGGQICANSLAANLYPTTARATGVGWALGVGRSGSVLGPLIAGTMVAMHWQTSTIFAAAAIPAIIAAWAVFVLGRLVRSNGATQRAGAAVPTRISG